MHEQRLSYAFQRIELTFSFYEPSLLTSGPAVGWSTEIGADVAQADESLRHCLADLGEVAVLVTFWQIVSKVGWATNLNA
jgi:hypothetical protein|tara:strand:- start:11 stop:250 length:240 start_codon:yes stop_codon:yes gene_type:complete